MWSRQKRAAEEAGVSKGAELALGSGLLELGKMLKGEKPYFTKVLGGAKETGTEAGVEAIMTNSATIRASQGRLPRNGYYSPD